MRLDRACLAQSQVHDYVREVLGLDNHHNGLAITTKLIALTAIFMPTNGLFCYLKAFVSKEKGIAAAGLGE
jgi:hypothetical protein